MKSDAANTSGFIVTRTIDAGGIGDAPGMEIEKRLADIAGVYRVQLVPDKPRLRVTYDQSRLSFGQIEDALSQLGCRASGGRWSRIKRAWYCYLDENAGANARSNAACCSKPPGMRAGPRKD